MRESVKKREVEEGRDNRKIERMRETHEKDRKTRER